LRRALLAWLVLVTAVCGPSGPASAADGTAGPMPTATAAAVASLRPKPSPRPYAYPTPPEGDAAGATRGGGPLGAPAPDPAAATPAAAGVARLDDPVLRWLPEIAAATAATGTPGSLIAGIMQLESGGDPETVSVAGAQGLMQVMPAEFAAKGIGADAWRDPATNVLTGARILAERSGGGWEAAVAYYFGIGCDAYGTCTQQYAAVVLGWANYYAAVLGDGMGYDVGRIPAVPSAPTPTPEPTAPPESPNPTGTADPAQPAEPTAVPTEEPAPTEEPTAPPEPTLEPAPTEVPAPTEAPTEIPVEAPTDEAAAPEPTPDGG
jgi:soluble lytic murein transglycosylase-like protein